MKQSKINKAYFALQKLSSLQLPVRKAYAVYKLLKIFEDPFKFELSYERSLLDKYEAEFMSDGSFRFKSIEDAEAFEKELNAANDMDVELEFTALHLEDSDLSGGNLTAADILALEEIVLFD